MDAGRAWYEIWVPQDPGAWSSPKLVFRDIAEKPAFWMDFTGSVVNGDCYWLTSDVQADGVASDDLLWLAAAIGNSTFIERFYDCRFNNRLYAGRRRFATQYVEGFPLPDPRTALGRAIIEKAKHLFESIESPRAGSTAEELDSMVWEAFDLAQRLSTRHGAAVPDQESEPTTPRGGAERGRRSSIRCGLLPLPRRPRRRDPPPAVYSSSSSSSYSSSTISRSTSSM